MFYLISPQRHKLFYLTDLSTVKAVIVKTVALVKLSAANLWNLHTVSENGYSGYNNKYTSSGKAVGKKWEGIN